MTTKTRNDDLERRIRGTPAPTTQPAILTPSSIIVLHVALTVSMLEAIRRVYDEHHPSRCNTDPFLRDDGKGEIKGRP